MSTIQYLGNQIKISRKNKKVSQEKLAELCGVHVNTLKSIESGKSDPSVTLFAKICSILDLSLDELLNNKKIAPSKSELIFQIISVLPKLNDNQLAAILALSESSIEQSPIATGTTA